VEGPADGNEGDGVEGPGQGLGFSLDMTVAPHLTDLYAKSSKERL
jgi:hypothetical protein